MNHVRVITTNGNEVEITHEEFMRLVHSTPHPTPQMTTHPRETREHYQNRAYLNICEDAEKHGIKHIENTEKDMKELMIYALKHNDADMIGEIIEWFIAEYTHKIGA